LDIGLLVSVNVEKEFVREISVQPTCGAQNEYWEKEMNPFCMQRCSTTIEEYRGVMELYPSHLHAERNFQFKFPGNLRPSISPKKNMDKKVHCN
jgi:hypothetical protein